MDESDWAKVFIGVVLVLMVASLCFCLGRGVGADSERRKAIEANVARYTIDATTGETEFVYGSGK